MARPSRRQARNDDRLPTTPVHFVTYKTSSARLRTFGKLDSFSPPVSEMRRCLEDLEVYMNEPGDLPHLVRLALAHYQFETIHPFRVGNGRVGWPIVPLLLCISSDSKPLLSTSAHTSSDSGPSTPI